MTAVKSVKYDTESEETSHSEQLLQVTVAVLIWSCIITIWFVCWLIGCWLLLVYTTTVVLRKSHFHKARKRLGCRII